MARARRASCGGHTPSARESSKLAAARRLGHERRAESRRQAGLLSDPQAEAFLPPAPLACPGAGARRAGALSLRNDRDCEGYHPNPRQSSFRTCAATGSVRDGSRSLRAAERRAELVGGSGSLGGDSLSTRRRRQRRGLPAFGAREAQPGLPLALDSWGSSQSLPRGDSRAGPALASSTPAAPALPCLFGRRGCGAWELEPRRVPATARSFPGFPCGGRVCWVSELTCGPEVAKSCNSCPSASGRGVKARPESL
ncbi:uncharacterized protein LOC117066030 [Trachypithecus francoisi]|uniref:uncharacterized protein LOC117066030 n=1 Tax=Trachypithecus francoisi TaxID=54180 RepID=UPI00141B0676|nr:uncharacterized protein LOC117066030 [Trachypithecus francoisi]